jgi:hypothetical protein
MGSQGAPEALAITSLYSCQLIIWYLPVGITLSVGGVSAADAAYIPAFHRLPIYSCMKYEGW